MDTQKNSTEVSHRMVEVMSEMKGMRNDMARMMKRMDDMAKMMKRMDDIKKLTEMK